MMTVYQVNHVLLWFEGWIALGFRSMWGDESTYRTVKGVTQECQAKCTWDGWLSFDYVLFFPKKRGSIFQIFQDLDLVQESFSEERFRWICCYGIRQMLPLRSLRVYCFSFSQGACQVDFFYSPSGFPKIPFWMLKSSRCRRWTCPCWHDGCWRCVGGRRETFLIWTNHWPNLANP